MGRRVMLCAATALLAGAGLVLALQGYAENLVARFFVGAVGLALALGPLAWFGLRGWLPAFALRAIAMIGIYFSALLAIEAGWRVVSTLRPEGALPAFYNYEMARDDPWGFRRWWVERIQRFLNGFDEFGMKDPRGISPYVLIPSSDHTIFESEIHVNAFGFRGREIARAKGDHFRIVALGESTTHGLTLLASDRTWPALLEQWIAERFECAHPVEVINAGMPGWTLVNQVRRLRHDVFPLEPDLLLSYHGYNGFDWFLFGLESVKALAPPELPERPSWILGGIERALLLSDFRRRYNALREGPDTLAEVPLLKNAYAQGYQQLIRLGRRNGSDVVLATFNMAVNADSPEEVVRFYEFTVPDVRMRIRANELHSRMLREVGRKAGVRVIETGPGVDGAYEDGFIDIAHMTQTGRERLAENLLTGLEESIGATSRAGCVRKP